MQLLQHAPPCGPERKELALMAHHGPGLLAWAITLLVEVVK